MRSHCCKAVHRGLFGNTRNSKRIFHLYAKPGVADGKNFVRVPHSKSRDLATKARPGSSCIIQSASGRRIQYERTEEYGIVSCLRTYTTDELRTMTEEIAAAGYQWEIGQERAKGAPIATTYLIGYPSKRTGE